MTAQFDLGLWNVWLGALPLYLAGFVFALFGHKEAFKRMVDISWYSAQDKRTCTWCMLFFYAYLLCSLAVPLKLGTPWFYVGLTLYVPSFICLMVAFWNYFSTQPQEPIIRGVYRISRNPLYFFTSLGFLGLTIAAGSWPLMLLLICYSYFQHLIIRAEEKYCLATYGDAYRQHLRQVPRYLLFKSS